MYLNTHIYIYVDIYVYTWQIKILLSKLNLFSIAMHFITS